MLLYAGRHSVWPRVPLACPKQPNVNERPNSVLLSRQTPARKHAIANRSVPSHISPRVSIIAMGAIEELTDAVMDVEDLIDDGWTWERYVLVALALLALFCCTQCNDGGPFIVASVVIVYFIGHALWVSLVLAFTWAAKGFTIVGGAIASVTYDPIQAFVLSQHSAVCEPVLLDSASPPIALFACSYTLLIFLVLLILGLTALGFWLGRGPDGVCNELFPPEEPPWKKGGRALMYIVFFPLVLGFFIVTRAVPALGECCLKCCDACCDKVPDCCKATCDLLYAVCSKLSAALSFINENCFTPVCTAVGNAVKAVCEALSAAANMVGEFFAFIWRAILWPVLGPIYDVLVTAAKLFHTHVVLPIGNCCEACARAVAACCEWFDQALKECCEAACRAIASACECLHQYTLGPLWEAALAVWGVIGPAIATAWQAVYDALAPCFTALAAVALTYVLEPIGDAATRLAYSLLWLLEAFSTHIGQPLVEALAAMLQALANAIEALFRAMAKVFNGLAGVFSREGGRPSDEAEMV